MSADGAGIEALGSQQGSAGRSVGPKLLGTLFVPYGVGIAWQDASGNWWQQVLVDNADGTPPFLMLQQVNI